MDYMYSGTEVFSNCTNPSHNFSGDIPPLDVDISGHREMLEACDDDLEHQFMWFVAPNKGGTTLNHRSCSSTEEYERYTVTETLTGTLTLGS